MRDLSMLVIFLLLICHLFYLFLSYFLILFSLLILSSLSVLITSFPISFSLCYFLPHFLLVKLLSLAFPSSKVTVPLIFRTPSVALIFTFHFPSLFSFPRVLALYSLSPKFLFFIHFSLRSFDICFSLFYCLTVYCLRY